VDDIDFLHAFEGLEKAPGVERGFTGLIKSMESHDGDPHFGKTLKLSLESSSALSEVNVTKVEVPINPTPEGTRRSMFAPFAPCTNMVIQWRQILRWRLSAGPCGRRS
jgi:hypothetical protein